MFPGPRHARRRHRRVAERGAGDRHAWPEIKERFARLREALTLIRKLWREERVSFAGEYYRTENATIYDRPETPVPIYIAAAGPMMAKYAGRAGDGFICTSGKAPELYRDTLLPNVAAGLEAAGRAPRRHRPHDRDEGLVRHRPRPRHARIPGTGRRWRCRRKRRCRSRTRWRWSGSPTRCRSSAPPAAGSCPPIPTSMSRRSPPYVDLGFRHLVFHAPGPDQERFLRLYAKDVAAPAARAFRMSAT